MTASADNANPQPEQPQAFAGFSTGPLTSEKTGKKTGSHGADMDAVDHLQKIADAAKNGAAEDPYKKQKSGMAADFDNTEFMRLLTMLYGIKEIPTSTIEHLKDFTLDDSQPKPTNADGTLYAKLDGAAVEITRDSITTDAAITPALAYKMAAAAALNPNYKAVTLSGSLEDRVMLTFAAKHFGLDIDDSSKPTLSAEEAKEFAAKFQAFEAASGLESVCAKYAQDEAPAATAGASTATPKTNKQPMFANMAHA